jgi:hypothetical protein
MHGNASGAQQSLDARQRNFRTTKSACMAELVMHASDWDARQSLCRTTLARRTAKKLLSSMALPYDLCRAASHSKDFTVCIEAFALHGKVLLSHIKAVASFTVTNKYFKLVRALLFF